jgi:hypothetical protein
MSIYKKQEFDFILRTFKIIEQYQLLKLPKEENYEVTLMINCMVGLLVLPQQQWFSHLPKDLISTKDWGIDPAHISFIKESKTVNEIAKHLRNALSHYNFTAFAGKSSSITKIKFKDIDSRNGVLTFEATIPISNLMSFLKKISSSMLEIMKSNK